MLATGKNNEFTPVIIAIGTNFAQILFILINKNGII
jgi:hypothetical protein